ncbi:hexulose-6-phosphate isomerase [Rubritalea squalenifaciens DSM 18772]|uniref:Hexulose-6-phosphate isomerase n=1 Tax=Rubritalea squalenifaciens DSM 18772 TaxID=1123071 RepID=A0A1M6R3G9_9BACT|nr:sugar phosphate isomerase/epimerase family protein [Rubritalea squalenifaciens]SHK26966.1 hexulose-6-phosphate isomerase [Rubritalea squalenifaciens DSM 18772]
MTTRRNFLTTTSLATAALATRTFAQDKAENVQLSPERIKLSLKIGMIGFGKNPDEKFKGIQELGYDGMELNSPGGLDKKACLAASQKYNFPIHGVVDSTHWRVQLSSESEETREKALKDLITAIDDSALVGGNAVLVVPAVVNNKTTHQQAWERSIEVLHKAIPHAAINGQRILIENVWNNFLYDPKGGNNQTAEKLVKYLDEINSPWVGSYFDIGNIQKFGKPADWIRALGSRIVKLDVKDWGVKGGFTKIGEGDVDWLDVRRALTEINYSGWATAEVRGGDKDYCAGILARMRKNLLGIEG